MRNQAIPARRTAASEVNGRYIAASEAKRLRVHVTAIPQRTKNVSVRVHVLMALMHQNGRGCLPGLTSVLYK
jgi:hypothetical protein